jgi:ribonuclease HII
MASNNLMDNLQVDLQISPELQRLMRHSADIAPKASKKGLAAIAKAGSKNVKTLMRTEGFKESGNMIKSVRASTTNKKSAYGSKSRVAHILEDGAKNHVLRISFRPQS